MNRCYVAKVGMIVISMMAVAVLPALGAVKGVDYQQGSDQEVAEVKAVFDVILEAANRQDIATLDRYYHPDLTVIDSGGLTRGWDTYKATVLDQQYEAVVQNTVPHVVDSVGVTVQGDTSWVTYRFSTNAETAAGAKTFFGYGTVVLSLDVVEGWRAVHIQSAARELQPGETLH